MEELDGRAHLEDDVEPEDGVEPGDDVEPEELELKLKVASLTCELAKSAHSP